MYGVGFLEAAAGVDSLSYHRRRVLKYFLLSGNTINRVKSFATTSIPTACDDAGGQG